MATFPPGRPDSSGFPRRMLKLREYGKRTPGIGEEGAHHRCGVASTFSPACSSHLRGPGVYLDGRDSVHEPLDGGSNHVWLHLLFGSVLVAHLG